MFQRVQLHLEGIRALTWKQLLALKIGIDHEQRGSVIVKFTDDCRDAISPDHLTSPFSTMPGYDLIPAFCSGTHNERYKDAIVPDALCGALHMDVIHHMERVILEGVQLRQWQLHNLFGTVSRMDCWIL